MNCKVCQNTSAKNNSVSFFRFPKENNRCKDWAERCNLLNLYDKHGTLRFYKSFRICSDHFNPKDIVFDGRKKRLLQSAAPKILAQNKIKDEDAINSFNHDETFKLKWVENLCRLCAEERRNLTDVFGWRGRTLNLEYKLKYFPLSMTKYDVLPLKICQHCITKVNQFYDFITNCMKAETKLRIMLDLEHSDTNYNIIKTEDEEVNWDSGIGETSLKETPKSEGDNSSHVVENSSYTIIDSYNEFDQVLQENLNSDMDYFCEPPLTNYTERSPCFKLSHTIMDVDCSRNINYEHNYSNAPSGNQESSGAKIQTENDQKCSDGTKFSCDICLETFTNYDLLSAHCLSHSLQTDKKEELVCETCDKVLLSRYDLDRHNIDHMETNIYQCQICDKNIHKVAFQKPSLLHGRGNSFDYFMGFRNSQNKVQGEEKHFSEDLPKLDPPKRSLLESKQGRRRPKPLKNQLKSNRRCQFCDRLFKNQQVRLAHEKSHGGESPYLCKLCRKRFRSRQSLRQHTSVHSDKRLFTCHECNTSFKRKDTLRNHLRIHTGERPFVCKFCGFAFKQRGDCMKHEKNHEKTNEVENKEEIPGVEVESVFESQAVTNPRETVTDVVNQVSDGTFWNDEKIFSLLPFTTIPEEITPTDTLEDLDAGRMTFNF